jgi:hypothetical protein
MNEIVDPIVDHIQITVNDLSVAESFYDQPRVSFAISSPRKAFAGGEL